MVRYFSEYTEYNAQNAWGIPIKATNGIQQASTGNTTVTSPNSVFVKNNSTKEPNFDTQVQKWFGLDQESWAKLTPEQKQKKSDIALREMIKTYNSANEKKMTVSDQYKIYISRCSSEEEVIRLTKTVKSMDTKDQLLAFKSSYKYEKPEFRDIAESILATDYTKLDKGNIIGAAKEIAENFSQENQIIAAGNASECDKSVQVEVVKTYQSIEDKDINKTLIDQYAKYAKENQLDIHTIMSDSKLSETVEYAASNIWHFDKDNQAKAVQITVNTDNEKAIIAASQQYAKYDQSVQSEIKSIIQNTSYDSAKEALAKAEEKANIAAQEEAKMEAEEKIKSEEKAKADSGKISEEIKKIAEAKTGKKQLIAEFLKYATESEKMLLIDSIPPSELAGVIGFIFQNSSVNVAMSALNKTEGNQKIISEMDNTYASKILGRQIGLLSTKTQQAFIDESSKNGNLSFIDKNMLSAPVRENLVKKQNEGNA